MKRPINWHFVIHIIRGHIEFSEIFYNVSLPILCHIIFAWQNFCRLTRSFSSAKLFHWIKIISIFTKHLGPTIDIFSGFCDKQLLSFAPVLTIIHFLQLFWAWQLLIFFLEASRLTRRFAPALIASFWPTFCTLAHTQVEILIEIIYHIFHVCGCVSLHCGLWKILIKIPIWITHPVCGCVFLYYSNLSRTGHCWCFFLKVMYGP